MYNNNEDFNEILRNLGKSVISENCRDSLQFTLTPRISYQVISESDLKKDYSEGAPSYRRPLEYSPNRPSNFSRNKAGISLKRVNSLEMLGSWENPMFMIDKTDKKTKILKTEEFIEYRPSNELIKENRDNNEGEMEIPLRKAITNGLLEKKMISYENQILLLSAELERLESEGKSWCFLYKESEKKVQEFVIENEKLKKELILIQKNKIAEIEGIIQAYDQTKKAELVI